MNDHMREEFEAHCREGGFPVATNDRGGYRDPDTHNGWDFWQAAYGRIPVEGDAMLRDLIAADDLANRSTKIDRHKVLGRAVAPHIPRLRAFVASRQVRNEGVRT